MAVTFSWTLAFKSSYFSKTWLKMRVALDIISTRAAASTTRASRHPAGGHPANPLLEKELGATLFQRTTRKVSLTAEGLAFLSDAQQIQALTHRALDRFAHPQDQPFVPFALGSVFHLHLLWLAPALRRLREELPSLHPMLQVAGGPYLQQLLEEGSLEGVLGFALPARRKSGISFQEVRRAPMVCLLPEGHPLAGRESLSLEDLSGQRLVLFDPSKPIPITTGAMSQMLGARTPAELYFAQSPEAMAALVQAGYGVGFLPDVFPPWGCGCARVPLRGMEPASLGLYYRARQASAPLKALLRILRERDSRPKPRETMGKHRDI